MRLLAKQDVTGRMGLSWERVTSECLRSEPGKDTCRAPSDEENKVITTHSSGTVKWENAERHSGMVWAGGTQSRFARSAGGNRAV